MPTMAGSITIRTRNDGTPDRALQRWLVRAPEGTRLLVTAEHPRAGTVTSEIVVDG